MIVLAVVSLLFMLSAKSGTRRWRLSCACLWVTTPFAAIDHLPDEWSLYGKVVALLALLLIVHIGALGLVALPAWRRLIGWLSARWHEMDASMHASEKRRPSGSAQEPQAKNQS